MVVVMHMKKNKPINSTMLTIGQLAYQMGIKSDTVRHYEKIGILTYALRSKNGYRKYDESSKKKLFFILKAKKIGFTLQEIKKLIMLSQVSQSQCHNIQEQVILKLDLIKEKMEELENIRESLQELLVQCQSNKKSKCNTLNF